MLSSKTKERIIELHKEGYKTSKIHAILGVSQKTIRKILTDEKVCEKQYRLSEDEKEQIRKEVISLYKSNTTIEEISKQLKIKEYLVRKYIKDEGIVIPKKKSNTKSDKYADKIIEMHKNGLSVYEIEKQVDLCRATIKNILIKAGVYNEAIDSQYHAKVVGRKAKPSRINTDEIEDLANIEKYHIHYNIVENNKDKIIELYKNGQSSIEISNELEVDTNLIKASLIEWDIIQVESHKKDILKGYILQLAITKLACLVCLDKKEITNKLKEWKAYELYKSI